jgi:hypothetical protein
MRVTLRARATAQAAVDASTWQAMVWNSADAVAFKRYDR